MNFRLKSCVWEITLDCCFACKYCGSGGGKARKNELTTDECLNIVEQLAELKCRRVSLIGGEVFMRADWFEIVSKLVNKGIIVSIITNGYLFDDELINKLKASGIESVAVSLDGTEEVHDKYRISGSFKSAISAIEVLKENGVPVSVISTLNSDNVLVLNELYGILCELKIWAWQLQACSPMGNVLNSNVNYKFDFKKVINFVATHINEAPFIMGIADNIGYYTSMEGYLRGNMSGKAVYKGCRAGLSSIGIDSMGNVRGCESMYDNKFIEGNLRNVTLKEIWESPFSFSYNRNFRAEMLSGQCSACEYGGYCAGGCRSYNYFVHGKLYESPFCAKTSEI